jgi:hypothetical protein
MKLISSLWKKRQKNTMFANCFFFKYLNTLMKKIDFNFALQGVDNTSVDTLISTIKDINSTFQEIANQIEPGTKLELRVRPFQKGSFEIPFMLLSDPSVQLSITAIKPAFEYLKTTFRTFKELLELKKFFKGEKPVSVRKVRGDNYEFENNSGEVKIVKGDTKDIYLENPVVNININNTFNTLYNDKKIKAVKIKDNKGKDIFEVTRKEIEKIATNNPAKHIKNKIAKTLNKDIKEAKLSVYKVVFGSNYKWEFYYEGHKIIATIVDKGFQKKVDAGKISFKNGDTLITNLKIYQNFNDDAKAYVNTGKYDITKVINIYHAGTQTQMDFEN